MQAFKNKSILLVAAGILVTSACAMLFMLWQLKDTEEKVAYDLIEKPLKHTQDKLTHFFDPVRSQLLAAKTQGKSGFFIQWDEAHKNNYFIPILREYDQISSMGIAHSDGYEMDILPDGDFWNNRIVDFSVSQDTQRWVKIDYSSTAPRNIDVWFDKIPHDPRERTWFKGAIRTIDSNTIHWTKPYIYNTTGQLGITASVGWNDPAASLQHVLAYDLTLEDLSRFTRTLNVSENGFAFILSDGKLIGLPDPTKTGLHSDTSGLNKSPHGMGLTKISKLLDEHGESKGLTQFEVDDETWWGSAMVFELSPDNVLIMGVVLPQKDVTKDLARTRFILIGGFSFVFLLSLLVFRSLRQTHKANLLLGSQNKQIIEQKEIIEEKNKDIVDSISYAKRIQTAILPVKSFPKVMGDQGFVYFLPKDIVSGDFYWLGQKDGKTCFTVSDCTGHGVPGAFMSMIGTSLYNQVILEKGITRPSEVLYEVRKGIINSLKQQGAEGEQKDGMDAAFCTFNENRNELQFAGANNPLYLIRKSDKLSVTKEEANESITSKYSLDDGTTLFEVKADKQPIGFHTGEQKAFTTVRIDLQKGDVLYLFSDGFADQFGGEKGKKYKYSNFKRFLLRIHDSPMEKQKEQIENEFKAWMGDNEQLDDVCIIGYRI